MVYSRFAFNRFLAMRKHTYKEMEKTLSTILALPSFLNKKKWYGKKIVVASIMFISSELCSNCFNQNKNVKNPNLLE
ncbi:hypothetical protein [Bacillus thuringiensis]|uniref:hypothetical protein n=1 Tax=Bacillus cereus group TaxID=86661 RepID=UPI00124E11CF|nr:hypothetical protein F8170_10935 [Bacillus cereus]KAB2428641.1 hypothetical protein F8168_17520 [Bacillus cereus]